MALTKQEYASEIFWLLDDLKVINGDEEVERKTRLPRSVMHAYDEIMGLLPVLRGRLPARDLDTCAEFSLFVFRFLQLGGFDEGIAEWLNRKAAQYRTKNPLDDLESMVKGFMADMKKLVASVDRASVEGKGLHDTIYASHELMKKSRRILVSLVVLLDSVFYESGGSMYVFKEVEAKIKAL